jgi:hypothetical protein
MTKWVVSGTYGRKYNTYHTDKDCFVVHGNLVEATDNIIEAYNLTECSHCSGENDADRTHNKQPCPIGGCDEKPKKLPNHIENDH